MECQYCKKILSTKSILKTHQQTAKYCLKKQCKEIKGKFLCELCKKDFQTKAHLYNHSNICVKNTPNLNILINENNILKKEIAMLKIENEKLRSDFNNLATTAVLRPFEEETTIKIDDPMSENQSIVCDLDEDEDDKTDCKKNCDYQLTPLEVGQGYTIEHRDEDGYINVTNLCKAGGKQFKAWKRNQKTKAFLQVLSSEVNIFTSDLIKLGTGSNYKNSSTWVHPLVAINIAQWISPRFDVKVSGWVYEIMMTGKVDITNTKSYKELQKENKTKDIKIQYLTKKYVKSQPRVQYKEKNVVYILTTKRLKKDRVYILGKAANLTSRLSTYNKSDEHEVVYYASCGDEKTMSLVENMVFQRLNDYREQANRERFILPSKKYIGFFSDVIKKSVDFFNK